MAAIDFELWMRMWMVKAGELLPIFYNLSALSACVVGSVGFSDVEFLGFSKRYLFSFFSKLPQVAVWPFSYIFPG